MKEEYILTSIDKNDLYHVRFIDKFYSLERAEKAYKEAKKDKLSEVKLSKRIK